MNKYKTIDGIRFELKNVFTNKTNAKKEKDFLKRNGYGARIILGTKEDKGKYGVYFRRYWSKY